MLFTHHVSGRVGGIHHSHQETRKRNHFRRLVGIIQGDMAMARWILEQANGSHEKQ